MKTHDATAVAGGLQTVAGSILVHSALVGNGVGETVKLLLLLSGLFIMVLGMAWSIMPKKRGAVNRNKSMGQVHHAKAVHSLPLTRVNRQPSRARQVPNVRKRTRPLM